MRLREEEQFWYLIRSACETSGWQEVVNRLKLAWEREEEPRMFPAAFLHRIVDRGIEPEMPRHPSERAKALRERLFGDMLSVDEVAYVLDVDRSTVLRYVRDNAIFAFKVGGREWCIPEQSIRDYVQNAIARGKEEG